MANKPIKIKDYNNPVNSIRTEFNKEEHERIRGKSEFIFHSYKTEKERLDEYMKNKDTIYSKVNIQHLDEPTNLIHQNTPQIVQPSMRFKSRTDLERIYDAIN